MIKKLQLSFLVMALMSCSILAIAQTSLEIANKQFELGDFSNAIISYNQLLDSNAQNPIILEKLGKSYVKTQQYDLALEAYDSLMKSESLTPNTILDYAHLLKKVGSYDRAEQYYLQYATFDPEIGLHYANSCTHAKEILGLPADYDVELLDASSNRADFGNTFFKGNIIFSSFRDDLKRDFHSSKSPNGNELFISYAKNNKGLTRISFLRTNIVTKRNIGALSYDDKLVAYTSFNFTDSFILPEGNENDMSIYFGEVATDLGDWKKDVAFIFNSTEYANAFPCLTSNGSEMYFASNMPGGFGGFDIYVTKKIGDSWGKPENLGPTVNTMGNEITPWVKNSMMYFSSDYHLGMGGYDVFSYEQGSDEIHNLGLNVNSPMDDYFYIQDDVTGAAYITSNRIGGKGSDDIYLLTPTLYQAHVDSPTTDDMLVPEALDLNDLVVEANNEEGAPAVSVAYQSNSNITERISSVVNNYFSMDGATKIDKQSEANIVYFIQLASFNKSDGNVKPFKKLSQIGDIFKVHKGYSTKIRLGYFYDREEAEKMLSAVKSNGFKDAFVVADDLNALKLELIVSSSNAKSNASVLGNSNSNNSAVVPTTTYESPSNISNYKIRLASYSDPLWFDIGSVKDIGEIEQWTKGEYTIFVLSGYSNIEAVRSALIKAKNRGFKDAHIVRDQNGYLEKITEN